MYIDVPTASNGIKLITTCYKIDMFSRRRTFGGIMKRHDYNCDNGVIIHIEYLHNLKS